jgi:hypothetical protein
MSGHSSSETASEFPFSEEVVNNMTELIITDIRRSAYNGDFDLITAMFLSTEDPASSRLLSMAEERCNCILVLESATAERDFPPLGLRKGDQFVRMWARSGHGLKVGEEMRLNDTR